MNRKTALLLAGALIALASLSAGCSSGTEADPTPVKTFKITPASSTRTPSPAASPSAKAGGATAAASPSAVTTAAAASPTAGASTAATLDLVALNLLFDKAELTASPGPVTIRLDNKDGGIPHNIHVFKLTSASGDSVGATTIEAGPVKQELKVTLEAGPYFYQCDVHPATMTGKITVQ